MDPLVIAFGLGVGILVGLTGIGGGSLMTPLLLIFIGTNPVVAVGTDIAYGAITRMLGSALGVISKAGADLSAWAILGPPVLVGMGAYAFQRRQGRVAAVVSTA